MERTKNILGVKINGHDTCASIISNHKIVSIAEERLNRVKHSYGYFPTLAIAYCLDALGLHESDIDLVVIVRAYGEHDEAVPVFHEKTQNRFAHADVRTMNHHDAHAASAFFCSPFEESAILVYDGSGSYFTSHHGVVSAETETLYVGRGNTFEQIAKTSHAKSRIVRDFPYSMGIGKLYETLSKYIGMGPNNEGKMMGLAGYGDDSFLKKYPLEKWFRDYHGTLLCVSDLRFPVAPIGNKAKKILSKNIFLWLWDGIAFYSKRVRAMIARTAANVGDGMLQAPRLFPSVAFPLPPRTPDIALPDQYYSSVAYAGQKVFEAFAIAIGKKLRTLTKSDNICVAGGCGLNIDANRNFLTEVGFKDIFIQPGSSDCGLALGAVLYGWHVVLDQPRFWRMDSAALGRPYSEEEILKAITSFEGKIVHRKSQRIAQETAKMIANEKIVGWFSGGSEHGPRALGHRSIICDARHPDMRDILNRRVKHREMWRPFAASILKEKMNEWFDLPVDSPFMLLHGYVHKDKKDLVPSIVHIDGTCRIQTVTAVTNPPYYELLCEFEKLTGTPLIINTSFNLGGDPIVETPVDAIDSFLRTNMDYLVLESYIIEKKTT